MKRKNRILLLVSLLLILLGVLLLAVSIFSVSGRVYSWKYTPSDGSQLVDLRLDHASIEIRSASKTYVEVLGYSKNELIVREEDGRIVISNERSLSNTLFAETPGGFIQSLFSKTNEARVVLYLSEQQAEKPINIVLHDSSLELSLSFDRVSLYAEESSIKAEVGSFDRFDLELINCNAHLSIATLEDEFSRKIETHATGLTINGDCRANSSLYTSSDSQKLLSVKAEGGDCRIDYPCSSD